MIVRKLNYYRLTIFVLLVIFIIFGIIKYITTSAYKKTYDYKLLNIGYKDSEITKIKSKLNDIQTDLLLKEKYNEYTVSFLDEKYFIFKNLNAYLDYKAKNDSKTNKDIVAIINSEANIEWIDEERETDITKGDLMLVNRIYGLKSDYEPEDIVDVPTQYAYAGKKISESILDYIIDLIEDGKEDGYTFVVSDGYRSYKEQEKLFNNYKDSYGISEADKYVARPGHSEYQTGISFDLSVYNKVIKDTSTSEEYLWLKNNAYKYGFIFRFSKEKESLTGFKASSFRLRYVGSEASTIIYNEDICFEEYYAYFVNK